MANKRNTTVILKSPRQNAAEYIELLRMEMLVLRNEGKTLREIGELYHLSRQRVCQIIGPTGWIKPAAPAPRKKVIA